MKEDSKLATETRRHREKKIFSVSQWLIIPLWDCGKIRKVSN
jgi:hypothetical protein